MSADLQSTLVPVLTEHYPGLGLTARWADHHGMRVFEIVRGDLVLCWVDGDVFDLIIKGDDAALEIAFDEIDNALTAHQASATPMSGPPSP